MAESLVDGSADGEEGSARVGGGAEPEAARHRFVGGAVSQSVERGAEDVVGWDRRERGVEIGGEESEEERERGLGHSKRVGPEVVGAGGGGGEEAAEPAFRGARRSRRRRRGWEREEGGG